MPLFFFISGYLEKNKTIQQTIRKGIKTLIIPYLLFHVLYLTEWFFAVYLRHLDLFKSDPIFYVLWKRIVGILLGVGYDTPYSVMLQMVKPLWFLVGLFFCKIAYSVLLAISKENIYVLTIQNGLCIVIVVILKKLNIDLFFSIDSALFALPFFSIGNILRNKRIDFPAIKNGLCLPCLATLGYLILIIVTPYNGTANINGINYGNNIFLFYVLALIGIVATVCFSRAIYRRSLYIIRIISSGTVVILACHNFINHYILKVIGMLDTPISLYIAIPVALTNILFSIIPIIIIEKHFPILIGGRK
jgi:fucose 4-O-acetylase-like acetyltransferase